MAETFSSRVRSLDCVAWETRFTTSGGTSLTPNFLAEDEKTERLSGQDAAARQQAVSARRSSLLHFLSELVFMLCSTSSSPPVLGLILDSSLHPSLRTADRGGGGRRGGPD